ncbi:GumC family protein [Parasphingorhabdus sp.]|uniref:GumC family protein n=1 Tax=Parasphingorhabdus sp. TaxID=2709688 RepID=UPI003D2B0E64
MQRKFDTSSYAREFLKQQLDDAAARLSESERESLDYARRTQIIDTSNAAETISGRSAPRSLTTATLVQINQEYATAFARRLEAQKKWETSRRTDVLNTPQVLNNLAVQNLLQERAKLEAELQDQLQRRKEDFPTVRQLNARVAELSRQISAISTSIRSSIQGEYQTALAQEKALKSKIEDLKGDTLDEQTQSVQLGILQRESDTNRELYDLLLKRYNELNAEAGVQSNNVSIIDRAKIPVEPVSPNIPLNLALSLLFGIGLSGVFVFGKEQIFDTLRSPDDVSRKLGVNSVGTIPTLNSGEDLQTNILDRKSQIAEAYSSVRTSLMLSSSHGVPRSLMFTSSQQGEGKSSSCFATAISLSRIGKRIVVVDLDLRRPSQHRFFGLKNDHGMSDLLSQNATIPDVLQKTEHENISFISSGAIPPNPTELLASNHATEVLRKLETEFDIVLVDSAPLLGLADAVVIGATVETCVFVIEANRNSTSTVRSAINRLLQGGAKLTGVLLCKFDRKQAGYNYDYSYQYEYREGSS